jgi:hypothetical protein
VEVEDTGCRLKLKVVGPFILTSSTVSKVL